MAHQSKYKYEIMTDNYDQTKTVHKMQIEMKWINTVTVNTVNIDSV